MLTVRPDGMAAVVKLAGPKGDPARKTRICLRDGPGGSVRVMNGIGVQLALFESMPDRVETKRVIVEPFVDVMLILATVLASSVLSARLGRCFSNPK